MPSPERGERLEVAAIDALCGSAVSLRHALSVHGPTLRALLGSLVRVGQRLDDALRTPSRIWHARRVFSPAGTLARLFVLHDHVTLAEGEGALADVFRVLLDAGALFEERGEVTSRLQLAMSPDSMCFGDWHGAEAILPLGGATVELLRVAGAADRDVGCALDLGCGAGAVAIAMARVAKEVVATDIDERAAAFTRLNVRLNGARNVDVRVGNLYEPVRGERFDRIAAQPPFHALRPGIASSAFVHGGVRGDELAAKMIAQAPEHLTEGGTMVLLADWPMLDEGDIATRVRPKGANVVVLRSPNKDLDEYCTLHAAAELSGDAFARAVIAQRDHLDALGVRGIALAWVVLQRAPHLQEGWASEVSVKHPHDAPMTWEHVSRIFRAHEAAHATDEVLRATRLAAPEGARFVEQPLGDGASAVVVHPPPGWPEWPSVLDPDVAASVKSLVKAGRPTNGAEIAAARRALVVGALQPATS